MKLVIIIFYSLVSISCFSQADSSFFDNFWKTPLKDCQVYRKVDYGKNRRKLIRSFEFDKSGRIQKELCTDSWYADTTLIIYKYNNSGQIISEFHYSKLLEDSSLVNYMYSDNGKLYSKIQYGMHTNGNFECAEEEIYNYNENGLLENFCILNYYNDTTILKDFEYHENGLIKSKTVRNLKSHDGSYHVIGHKWGVTNYEYDNKGRLIQSSYLAKTGEKNQFDFSSENSNSRFYYHDSIVEETFINHHTYEKKRLIQNSKKKPIIEYTVSMTLSGEEFKTEKNGVPDVENNIDHVNNQKAVYSYDEFDRIKQIVVNYCDYFKEDKKKPIYEYSTEIIYNKNGYFNIPFEQFISRWR